MTPRRAALLAAALASLAALLPVAVDRARPAPTTTALRHLDDALATAQQRRDDATTALAARVHGRDGAALDAAFPAAMPPRSVELLDAHGTVLAARTLVDGVASCPTHIVARDTATAGVRLVVTWDGDCALRASRAALMASSSRGAPVEALLLALLAAVAAFALVTRAGATATRRLSVFATAAERVGAGDLTVRVKPGGDAALDALAAAFNQMVEELALTRERIDYLQRLAGWQDVARRLAHEIKNPLTPIQLAVQEVARKYSGDDAKFKRTLDTAREVVEEEVATLRRLVTAFSEFARLPEVKTTAGDLAEFVRDMATAKQFIDEAAGSDGNVKVVFDAGEGAIPVRLDRIMLRRAFENLVRNAAQAIGARGGTVTVRAEKRRVTVAGVDGAPAEEVDQAWLVVEDDGPGIPPEHRAKVFDPYFTTKSDGTGLGLAIVRKIAIDHAGDVGLDERPGGGARFVITLPLHDPSRKPRRSFVTFTRNG